MQNSINIFFQSIIKNTLITLSLIISNAYAQTNLISVDDFMGKGYCNANSNQIVQPIVYINNTIPTLKIEINGIEYTFIFDTGAMGSYVSDRMSISNANLGKAISSNYYDNDDTLDVASLNFKIGDAEFVDCSFLVGDLSAINEAMCTDVHGILGMNVIGKYNWRIDPIAKTIMWSFNAIETDSSFVRIETQLYQDIIPLISLTFDNITFLTMIDTGSDGFLSLNPLVLKKSSKFRKTKFFSGYGYFEQTINTALYGKFKTKRLDTIYLAKDYYILDAPTHEAYSLPTLGSSFLNQFIWIMNADTQAIFFKPVLLNTLSNLLVFDAVLGVTDSLLLVSSVMKNSVADKSGLKPGARIISVDEFDTGNITNEYWCTIAPILKERNSIAVISKTPKGKIKRVELKNRPFFPQAQTSF